MIEWLTTPPVRTTDPCSPLSGSFVHSLDPTTGETSGQYTEITGYGVSLLTNLYRTLGDKDYLRWAHQAAEFLLRVQASDGSYPHRPDPTDREEGGPSYSFDTATCVTGLLDLHAVTRETELLDSARKAGNWLLTMQESSGAFTAGVGPENSTLNPGSFYGNGSCIHAKVGMALSRLATTMSDSTHADAARAVCEYVMSLQSSDGFFWAMPSRDFVFTHAHCYACEGLYAAGVAFGNESFTDAAHRGTHWLRNVQNDDGSVFQVYADRRLRRERLRHAINPQRAADATAQTARLIALTTGSQSPSFQRAVSFLSEQLQSPRGGLFYTKGRLGYDDTLYAWPTMFAIQALLFAQSGSSASQLF